MELLTDNDAGIARAAKLLIAGEVVAFPTETVYGLGADATRDAAVQQIYDAKGRPSHNPLIVHVPDTNAARRWASNWPFAAQQLAEAFWPGPLTIVVSAAARLSPLALAGGDTVGLRVPGHPTAIALLRACGLPLAAPSANRSGYLSPTEAQHVATDLEGRIPAVLDGGACTVGIESTVIDLTTPGHIRILRPGMITASDIAKVLGKSVTISSGPAADGALRSPGLLDRHYSPRVPLRIKNRSEVERAPAGVFKILLGDAIALESTTAFESRIAANPNDCAANLYRTLWKAQTSGAAEIWFERPPDEAPWSAIHDRLRRAAEPEQSEG